MFSAVVSVRAGVPLCVGRMLASQPVEESSLRWEPSIGPRLSKVSFWRSDVHTPADRVCTNSDSRWADTTITRSDVAHNTTRTRARLQRCVVRVSSLAHPLRSVFCDLERHNVRTPIRISVCGLPGVVLLRSTTNPALLLATCHLPIQAPTLSKRRTRKRCRGEGSASCPPCFAGSLSARIS